MKSNTLLFAVSLLASSIVGSPIQAEEYVARCPFNDKNVPDMLKSVEGLDVWSVQKTTIDIRVVNADQEHLIRSVIAPHQCHILIPNLNSFIHAQEIEAKARKAKLPENADVFFKDYQVESFYCYDLYILEFYCSSTLFSNISF